MAELMTPLALAAHLREAVAALSLAHAAAGEREDGRDNLNGDVRDLIFGLNTATESLLSMIETVHIDGQVES